MYIITFLYHNLISEVNHLDVNELVKFALDVKKKIKSNIPLSEYKEHWITKTDAMKHNIAKETTVKLYDASTSPVFLVVIVATPN